MKDLIKILSAVLLVTAINACTLQEVPDPTNGGGAITITAQTVQEQDVTNTPGTKTTLSGVETHWKGVDSYPGNPDKIGIFSPQARTTECQYYQNQTQTDWNQSYIDRSQELFLLDWFLRLYLYNC